MKRLFWISLLFVTPGLVHASEESRKKAIREGLAWLSSHQCSDGSWTSKNLTKNCKKSKCLDEGHENYEVGRTGLALLAFLRAEEAGLAIPEDAPVVEKAFRWIVSRQRQDGTFSEPNGEYNYNHFIATIALAAGARLKKGESLLGAARRSIEHLLKFQIKGPGNLYLGWRYVPGDTAPDSSVTSWGFLAMREARAAGIELPEDQFSGPARLLQQLTNSKFQVGYLSEADAGMQVKVPKINDEFSNHPSMAAAGLFVRLLGSERNEPWKASAYLDALALSGAVDLILADLPAWDPNNLGNDFYYWHHGTLALGLVGGKSLKTWQEALVKCLVQGQRKSPEGCVNGSWDGLDRWSFAGGRVYATAINVVSLVLAGFSEDAPKGIPAPPAWKKLTLRRWHLVGPFRFDVRKPITDSSHEPETKKFNPKDRFPVEGGKPLAWIRADCDKEGALDIRKAFPFDGKIAYAAAVLRSDKAKECVFQVQSDDGFELWLNGAKLKSVPGLRQIGDPGVWIAASLEQGVNTLLVKIANHEGEWGLRVSLLSASGGVQEGGS